MLALHAISMLFRHVEALEAQAASLQQECALQQAAAVDEAIKAGETQLAELRDSLAAMYEDRESTLQLEHDEQMRAHSAELRREAAVALSAALHRQSDELAAAHSVQLASLRNEHKSEVKAHVEAVEKANAQKVAEIVTACRKVESQSKLLIKGLEAEIISLKETMEEAGKM
jgi:hypothetical protein